MNKTKKIKLAIAVAALLAFAGVAHSEEPFRANVVRITSVLTMPWWGELVQPVSARGVCHSSGTFLMGIRRDDTGEVYDMCVRDSPAMHVVRASRRVVVLPSRERGVVTIEPLDDTPESK